MTGTGVFGVTNVPNPGGAHATDGSKFIFLLTPNPGIIEPLTAVFTFTNPIRAFGITITDFEFSSNSLTYQTSAGDMAIFATGPLSSGGELFFGITSDVDLTSVTLTNANGRDFIGMDEVYIGLSPIGVIQSLVETVLLLNIQSGISNSLDAKLDAALALLDDMNEQNDAAAINSLQAFINAVVAQSGKKIDEPDANDLIAKAQAMIDFLQGQ